MVAFNAVPKRRCADPRGLVRHRPRARRADGLLISFFPITVNIATGLATLEPELEDVLRVLGARRWTC